MSKFMLGEDNAISMASMRTFLWYGRISYYGLCPYYIVIFETFVWQEKERVGQASPTFFLKVGN